MVRALIISLAMLTKDIFKKQNNIENALVYPFLQCNVLNICGQRSKF